MNVYKINSPDVISDDFEDEVVIVNLKTGHYFSIQGKSGKIFNQLANEVPLDIIAAAFIPEAEISKLQMLEDLEKYAKKLEVNKILRKVDVPTSIPQSIPPLAYEKLTLSIFEDLDDIIMVDPIHEVNPGAGWPNKAE